MGGRGQATVGRAVVNVGRSHMDSVALAESFEAEGSCRVNGACHLGEWPGHVIVGR
ncbi:hypothetical protein chiPu_0024060, partial [Chiloscyllium punctatum]|nr:hypothetical protein [Chiloscyllium punctatum]